jgi:hypothetical protein
VNEKFRKKRNISLYYNYKMIRFDNIILATATYDKANEIVYATVNGGPVSFSKDDYVVLTVSGSSVLAQVEALETSGDWATIIQLDIDHNWLNSFFNSGSEQQVLIKVLSRSKSLVIPFATIDLPAVPTPAALSELKEQIESGLAFAQAVALLGLDTSSQVTVKIDEGNPKITAETFCADKVNANISKKGLEILSDRTRMGRVFTSDQPVKQELLSNYLQKMREELREQVGFLLYTVTVVDEKLNVIASKKPIKEILTFKMNGKRVYRFVFHDEFYIRFSGTYNVLIEKETVTNTDYLDWAGSSGMSAPYLNFYTQESPLEVKYLKKYDGLAFAYLELDRSQGLVILNNKLAAVTFANKTIYGSLNLTEDNNKVLFTKPANVSVLAWAKEMAAFKPGGTVFLAEVPQGFLAKDEMLQLKVDLDNVEDALVFFRQLQAIPTTSVDQLLSSIGTLKMLNAEISPEKAGVNALTGITTLDFGTVKWFDNSLEILLPPNSKETFNVVNSTGSDRYGLSFHQDVGIDILLDAALADIKTNYVRELRDVLNSSDTDDQGVVTWMMTVTSGGERFQAELYNADVIQNTSGTKYRFLFYDDQVIRLPLDFLSDCVQVTFNRTELVTI